MDLVRLHSVRCKSDVSDAKLLIEAIHSRRMIVGKQMRVNVQRH